jgi:tRNA dimethylallyltransferase
VAGVTVSGRHLALVGPTASGKSALALALARARPGVELVSVDSMQVYRGMDIGTAKPTPAEQAEVPHHLLDVADPGSRFTVTRFAVAAADALAGIEDRGHTAVLVGGTGLYLQAVLGDLQPPGEFPSVRDALVAEGAATAALHRRLTELDPVAAGRIEPENARRVLRALEVTIGSGRPFSSFGPGIGAYPSQARFSVVGAWLPRGVVAERIGERVAAMVAAGLVDEVAALADALGPTARQALGYKEVLAHVEDGADLDGCIAQTVARTRRFARRQRSWFRRDPRIRWYGTASDPSRLLPGLLVELDRCSGRSGWGDAA